MRETLPVEHLSRLSQARLAQEAAARNAPFIVSDVVTQWPAFSKWSLSYLGERIGDRRVKVGISANRVFHYGTQDHQQALTEEMPFDHAITRIARHTGGSGEHLYIMEQNSDTHRSVLDVYPELASDFAAPDAIENEKLLQTNLWIGTAGNVTPLHYDALNNFLAQISGRKRVHLFHPAQSPLLYPRATRQTPHNNTSAVLLLEPDYDKHPAFRDAVTHECVLQPGQMLYIPPYWWHHVESLDAAVSLNFWWKARLDQCLNPMGIQSIYFHHDRGELLHAGSVVDLSGFADLADVARYCLHRGMKCIAVVFAKAEVDRRRAAGRLAASAVDPWRQLIHRAERGDDDSLDDDQVARFLAELTSERRFS